MKKRPLIYDYTFLLSDTVGSEHGVTGEELREYAERTGDYHRVLTEERANGKVGFYDLVSDKKILRAIRTYAQANRKKFDNFVVLGIGGSALGNIALLRALQHPYHNLLDAKRRKGIPRIFILDNIDPELFAAFLESVAPGRTLFNVISKSGSTAETSAQFLIIAELLRKKLGSKFRKHMVITTDAEKGDLRRIAIDYDMQSFTIPDNVGGRFSVLSSVGLLTAAIAGFDLGALLGGASDMMKRCQTADLMKNPAYLNAVLHYLLDTRKNKHISVMMSYSNALYGWADWYRQLWAESLGKAEDRSGDTVHVGQTPVNALGVTDQHSQVQLYTEGPNDKAFTFLTVASYRDDVKLPKFKGSYSSLEYLSGNRLSTLFDAEMRATEFALSQRRRPSCRLIFPALHEYTIGQFIMMYQIQTAFAGQLYNINAFDQPGVEAGKQATYGLLGRKGFEKEAERIRDQEAARIFLK